MVVGLFIHGADSSSAFVGEFLVVVAALEAFVGFVWHLFT